MNQEIKLFHNLTSPNGFCVLFVSFMLAKRKRKRKRKRDALKKACEN
ncbi:hypothetical protein [Photobacterium kishitanii]|nr:hypothetical protein [Photobacterium kishitanii]